ncbi:claudin-19-like isoform X1 [Melozone crissalis]|uniref:claudin-19-like isoform X1 n=1 Tax=Melozone crissalis TaxID=40204 RepID=UPI0023DBB71A|nr:claudin-19-like isoform X1 [Melozone crissalis]
MASSCLQICALLLALAGFTTLLVTTMSSSWKVLDSTTELVSADWVSEGLWMDCAATAVGSVQCKKFLYMLSSDPHVQACRALMITSILLGFLAAVLTLLGMKCTNIGLSDEDGKMKFTVTGGFLFVLGGNIDTEMRALLILFMAFTARLNEINILVLNLLQPLMESFTCVLFKLFLVGLCSMVAISWYAAMVTAQFFDQLYAGTKYELGEGLYLGWTGSVLYILGGILLTCSCRGKEKQNYSPKKYAYSAAQGPSQPHMYPRNSETIISNKEYV